MKEMMLFLLLLLTVPVAAQSDWHEALREWLTAEDVEESYGEELLEQLEERAQTPINLNQTCREELAVFCGGWRGTEVVSMAQSC